MATCSNDIDLLLIGKTGNGKSSTGNSILNRNVFKSDASTTSVTKQIQVHYGDYNGRIIKVVDGPGVGDTELNGVKAYTEMVKTVFLAIAASPRGYHAFLLVVKYGGRFTKEDEKVIDILKTVFGKDFVKKFCVLVVTFGDNFRCDAMESDSFEDWCSSQTGVFRNLIVECGHRVVLFDNRNKDIDIQNKQLDRLLDIVDGLGYRGERYTDTYFMLAQGKRDEMMVDLNKPIICEESMKEASLILQGLGKIHLNKPDAQLKHLDILLERAENLLRSITEQDNNTGILQDVIQNARHIKETVEAQLSLTRNAIDIPNREKIQEKIETLTQDMYQHGLAELKREMICDRIQELEEENKMQLDKWEEEMRKSQSVVEGMYVMGNFTQKAIEVVGDFLIKTMLPAVLEILGKKLLNKLN